MATSYLNRLGSAPEEGVKAPVVVSASANITLSGEQTVGGVALVSGDRVLVRGQDVLTENGIYVVDTGAWQRATDFNAAEDVMSGVVVLDDDAKEFYVAQFTGDWTPGVTEVTFVAVQAAGLTGFTPGSIIFADAEGASTEDNTALFFDAAANRLAVGHNVPTATVDIDGTLLVTGSATLASGADMNGAAITNVLDPVSAQDAATKAYVDAATPSLTTAAVGFGDGSNALTGDINDIAWDATDKVLAIGGNLPAKATVHIRSKVDTGGTFQLTGTSVSRGNDLQAVDLGSGGRFGINAMNYDGDVMVVSAAYWDGAQADQGAVYTYDWNAVTATWDQRGTVLTEATPGAGNRFGRSLSLSGDGNTLAVGADRYDDTQTDQGRVYVYSRNGSAWTLDHTIDAPVPTASGNFGSGVSLSNDGLVLAVGAGGSGLRKVYTYDLTGGTWVKRAAELSVGGAPLDEKYGYSVALCENGATLYVSQPEYHDTGSYRGRIFRYAWTGAAWSEVNRVTNTVSNGLRIGHTISASEDASIVVMANYQGAYNVGTFPGTVQVANPEDGGLNLLTWDAVTGAVITEKFYSANTTDRHGFGSSVSGSGQYMSFSIWKDDVGVTDAGRVKSYTIASLAYPYLTNDTLMIEAETPTMYFQTDPGLNWRIDVDKTAANTMTIAYGQTTVDAPNDTYTTALQISNAGVVNANDAVTKTYADTKLALSGGTMTGAIAMGTSKITGLGTPTVSTDAATKAYVDTKLALSGGTMTGAIAMGTNKITGLGTPTVSTDAATKAYVDAYTIGAGSIGQTEIGSGAVHRDELNTSIGEVSTAVTTRSTLPGGEYGFYPQIRASVVTGNSGSVQITDGGNNPDTYTTTCYIIPPSGATMYVQQRYVNASPPYDLGDGEVPLFVFLHISSMGELLSTYAADAPPWAYNGPTNIVGKLKADGRKYQMKKTVDLETGEVSYVEIEITQAIKNADMGLIPHPFLALPEAGDSIVLLDPVATVGLLELHNAGQSIAELLHGDYIRFDNVPLNRATPNGVQAVDFTWRNTGAKPKGRKV